MSAINKNTVIVTTVGLIIGTAEALLYYNLGQSAGEKFVYKIPPRKEFFKTVSVVLCTSILTAGISAMIESLLNDKKNQPV